MVRSPFTSSAPECEMLLEDELGVSLIPTSYTGRLVAVLRRFGSLALLPNPLQSDAGSLGSL